jgi:molybdopterin synthase catalytic subunit
MGYLSPLPLDPGAIAARLADRGSGAVVTFVGSVRDHHQGRNVLRLDYSAYEPMAEAECGRIVAEAEARWPVKVALEHRVGRLEVGEAAVAIAVAGGHRAEAFEACRWVIEEVKAHVPIWKREYYADGTLAWVESA